MKEKKSWKISIFIAICIFINYFGKIIAEELNLPLWLDSVGTGFAAYVLGPICGAIAGATNNILYGIKTPASFAYIFVSIAIGTVIGICSRKGMMKNFFGAFTISILTTVIATIISIPINYFLFDGINGNLWGDGVFDMFRNYGFSILVSTAVGEFCVDFLDKSLTILLIYCIIKKRNLQKQVKSINCFFYIVLFIGMAILNIKPQIVYAKEYFEDYTQIIYNGENGLTGGNANAIEETKDGILWIGTNGGLYRYDGVNFKWMNEFQSVKNVNCLFVDEEGRLWIGTNDNGVSISINDNISNVIDEENGLSSNSVRCIGEDLEGNYYVGTSGSLSVLTIDGGLKIHKIIKDIVSANSISVSQDGYAAVITNEGKVFILKNSEIISESSSENENEYYTSCCFNEKGLLYLGTSNNHIYCFDISNGKMNLIKKIDTEEQKNIYLLKFCEDDNLWICSDNGAGYLDKNEKHHYIDTDKFDSSIDSMTMDYQGNIWFASSKLGLLKLCKSSFTEIYKQIGLEENVVNAVAEWQNKLYFGTDKGISIVDKHNNTILNDEISISLSGKKIRCLKTDSSNHLWICSFDGDGLLEIYPDGHTVTYNEDSGTISKRFRSVYELMNGTIVAAEDMGLDFIKNGKVIKTIGTKDGFDNSKILSIIEKSDGTLLAGTDGGGIAVIRNYRIIRKIKREDGLSSSVILKMVSDKDGIFIITSNAICYMDNNYKIKVLENFPYYNNYDLIQTKEGSLWITGSAGIHIIDKNLLLSGEKIDYELLDTKTGLEASLTANAWNYIDNNGNLYLPCNTGCYCVNMSKYDSSDQSYRMMVKYIDVDNVKYNIDKSEIIKIDGDAKRIEIMPTVINYSLNNPCISYYLEGFEEEPNIIRQSELKSIVYTNLSSGTYTFHIAVINNRKSEIIEAASYKFEKETRLFEYWWFKLYFVSICLLSAVWLTWFVTKLNANKTLEKEKMKLAIAEKQAEMGNETIIAIAKTVDAKDSNTNEHSERVAEYSVLLAKKLGWNKEKLDNIRKTALMHDIGKIGIPDSVLNKPSKLTDEEYAIMKSHVIIGAKILEDFTIVSDVADGARYHHERYDGKGYMEGLKGEEIPINARIIGIADAFDAMTSNRVYRNHLDIDYVIQELKKEAGAQFDPKIVELMIELIEDGTINLEEMHENKY